MVKMIAVLQVKYSTIVQFNVSIPTYSTDVSIEKWVGWVTGDVICGVLHSIFLNGCCRTENLTDASKVGESI